MKHFVSPHRSLPCQPDQYSVRGGPPPTCHTRRCKLKKQHRILNRNRKEKFTTKEVEEIKAFLENYSKIIIHNMLNEN
jgi:hypothetical protein